MLKNILNNNQLELLPLIKEFSREFYLVGGTAIALHLGHRQSIDFDLFKKKQLNKKKIIDKVENHFKKYSTLYMESNQLHLLINNVKVTFFEYGFDVPHKIKFKNIATMPSLIDLAAMKAYAIGSRAKWKDYVDLYFILKNNITFDEIANRGLEIFGNLFSKKLFRQQLCYFKDIDHTEEIIFVGKNISEIEVKEYLTEIALKPF
ncbi:MAG: nucleotidyl transferase AbiEii/AbiGii toxin family protein [Desulfobacterales bacterium]|nr:nucleotidyl transferase AbiEii/AbiGii toxin family protein [Desulfobacterales bacterium]